MSDETLQYPRQIAKEIGLGVHEVNAFKTKGCRFYGRKTSVKWVREFLNTITGAESWTPHGAHLPRLTGETKE